MALPPNWTKYTTDEGKDYYHNTTTNTTQWNQPEWPEPSGLGDLSSLSGLSLNAGATADVFTYQPSAFELESNPVSVPAVAAETKPSAFDELISLNATPTGTISADPVADSVNTSRETAPSTRDATHGGTSAGESSRADSMLSGVPNWLLGYAQQLFDVSTEDIVNRLRLVMLSFKEPDQGLKEEFRSRPDFYGPFWVATTAILFLAATGNFARLLESGGNHADFKADYSLVSLAAGLIYGSLLAVPLIARLSIFISGEDVGNVDFLQIICVCGYSLAPVIPVALLSLIPLTVFRTFVAIAGLAVAVLFIRQHISQEINVNTAWLKYLMIGGPCVIPASVLFVYRVHFFAHET